MIRRPLNRSQRHSNRPFLPSLRRCSAGFSCCLNRAHVELSPNRRQIAKQVHILGPSEHDRAARFRELGFTTEGRYPLRGLTRIVKSKAAGARQPLLRNLEMFVATRQQAIMRSYVEYYAKRISQRCITDRAKSIGYLLYFGDRLEFSIRRCCCPHS